MISSLTVPIDRYCISDRSDFKLNADGTLDIILSKDAPEDTSNWLPVSDGNFIISCGSMYRI